MKCDDADSEQVTFLYKESPGFSFYPDRKSGGFYYIFRTAGAALMVSVHVASKATAIFLILIKRKGW